MELLVICAFFAGFWTLKSREQQRRIALLGSHLAPLDIERNIEVLITGYLRNLDASGERQLQVWSHLRQHEQRLGQQLQQLAEGMADVWGDSVRISTLPIALPWADKLFPAATFDLRHALQIHARGFDAVCQSEALTDPKQRAFVLLAEMLLFQHTCHWFCRSKAVASARLLTAHKTAYAQVLQSVSDQTRAHYLAQLPGAHRHDVDKTRL